MMTEQKKDNNSRFQIEEEGGERRYFKLPIMYVTALAMISLIAIGLGEKIEVAVVFFLVFSGILVAFFVIVGEGVFEPVEEDLENLGDEGTERKS